MSTKKCKLCNKDKPYSEFHKMKKATGGVRNTCKLCRQLEKNEYTNRPEVKQKARKYYQDNKASIRVRTKNHYWTLNGQFHQYKKRAKKSGMEFLLSEEECKKFYQTKCVYCGGDITGLGIDRIDNKKGYIITNVVPCCSRCNFMKHVLSVDDFISHIKKILEFFNNNI